MPPDLPSAGYWMTLLLGAVLGALVAPFLNLREWREVWKRRSKVSAERRVAEYEAEVKRLMASPDLRALYLHRALRRELMSAISTGALLSVGPLVVLLYGQMDTPEFVHSRGLRW